MWTDEQRKAASERAKARWANPDYRASQGAAISKPANCPTCGESDLKNFYVNKLGQRTNSVCKTCHKKACNERWHSRSWVDRWSSRNYKYGVTKEFLVSLYDKQAGKCAICNAVPHTERGLHVDHCHKTKQVRGLLCHGCNTGIGAMKDSVDIISQALLYLKGTP